MMQSLADNHFTTSSHIPAFLAKLWKIVDDPSTNDLIYWSEHGNSFLIRNQSKFARELLPLYYKHNNMASFVRQLNMYGFHKVVSVEQGGLKVDKDEMEFAHPFFLRGSESTLELIKRKISSSKLEETRSARPDTINKIVSDVRQMRGRQESMDNKLLSVKRENEALWRELSLLRQKHAKQQQIVSKLLQFLVSMMSSQGPRLSFKRRMPMNIPLMLNDSESVKSAKMQKTGDDVGPIIHDVTESHGDPKMTEGTSGPVIFSPESATNADSPLSFVGDGAYGEAFDLSPAQISSDNGSYIEPLVDPLVVEQNTSARPQEMSSNAIKVWQDAQGTPFLHQKEKPIGRPAAVVNSHTAGDVKPKSSATASLLSTHVSKDPESVSTEGQINIMLPNVGERTFANDLNGISTDEEGFIRLADDDWSRTHFDGHIDDVQSGLDNLKSLLKQDVALDQGTLLSLFGTDSLDGEAKTATDTIPPSSGLDLVSYNPSLYELAEEDSLLGYDNDNSLLDAELESMLTTDREDLLKK